MSQDYWVSGSWRGDVCPADTLEEALEIAFDLIREGEGYLTLEPCIIDNDYVQVFNTANRERRRYPIGHRDVKAIS